MTYEDRDIYGIYKGNGRKGPGPELMGAGTLTGDSDMADQPRSDRIRTYYGNSTR